jgi:hypothetical protein
MFTPTITNKVIDIDKNIITLTVEYSDGNTTITQEAKFGTDQTWESIQRHLKNRAESLVKGGTEFQRIETQTPVEYVPTTEEAARLEADVWIRKVLKLEAMQKLVSLGVLTGNEKPLTDLAADIKATIKPAYLNLL